MVGSAKPREQRRALQSVPTPACLRERGREEKCERSERDPTYMEAVSHQAVSEHFVPAPKFQ